MKDKVITLILATAFSTTAAAQQISIPPVPPRPIVSPSALAALPTIVLELGDIPVLQQETPDILWRRARGQLNDDNYRSAAGLFARLIERYPSSSYVGDAHYWQAFAL